MERHVAIAVGEPAVATFTASPVANAMPSGRNATTGSLDRSNDPPTASVSPGKLPCVQVWPPSKVTE